MNIKKEVRLALLFCLALLPEAVNAQFTFTTSESGVIVTGYTGSSRVIKIPEMINNLPVIAVGANAFCFNTNVLSITIPNGVTSIGAGAFINCSGLRSVRMGYRVANIGVNAFYNTGLDAVRLPAGVTNIAEGAFDGCVRMNAFVVDSENVLYSSRNGVLFNRGQTQLIKYPCGRKGRYTIPASCVEIAADAFTDCQLGGITLPDGISTIPNFAFYQCALLKKISFPNGLESIGYDSFGNCVRLNEVMIPNSVTNIGIGAFSGCTRLMKVLIGSAVIDVDGYAFSGCNLKKVIIPSSVTNIGTEAFGSNNSLTGVYFNGDAPILGGYVFDGSSDVILYHFSDTLGWDTFDSEGHPLQVWNR